MFWCVVVDTVLIVVHGTDDLGQLAVVIHAQADFPDARTGDVTIPGDPSHRALGHKGVHGFVPGHRPASSAFSRTISRKNCARLAAACASLICPAS
uniref:Uncharacterized protein n=1 Tax=Siphoviridae sp. ctDsE1 TaxID=2825390 RepID=A0A8S5TYK1_9CAUD|nr:MAG TPA: hypothetical protein [Siphoviridae sp. ctDsE1]